MTVVACALAKDEADVVEGWARHLAEEVDHILIADNMSTDGTREILEKLADELPLTLVEDNDPAYYQSIKMSALAERAANELGATHIVAADLDELWFSSDGRLREVLPSLSVPIAYAALYNHLRTAVDVDDPDPFRSMVWRQLRPADLRKVAFRWASGAVLHQGNHGVTLPSGETRGLEVLEVRHFPVRSPTQFVRKSRNGAEAYKATDLPPTEGAHWRSYGQLLDQLGDDGFVTSVYFPHWHYVSPTDSGLVLDPPPYRRWEPAG